MTDIKIDEKVIDKFERPLISLRISITNRCNVRCFYCHHDGIVPENYEMTSNEMERIVKVAKDNWNRENKAIRRRTTYT